MFNTNNSISSHSNASTSSIESSRSSPPRSRAASPQAAPDSPGSNSSRGSSVSSVFAEALQMSQRQRPEEAVVRHDPVTVHTASGAPKFRYAVESRGAEQKVVLSVPQAVADQLHTAKSALSELNTRAVLKAEEAQAIRQEFDGVLATAAQFLPDGIAHTPENVRQYNDTLLDREESAKPEANRILRETLRSAGRSGETAGDTYRNMGEAEKQRLNDGYKAVLNQLAGFSQQDLAFLDAMEPTRDIVAANNAASEEFADIEAQIYAMETGIRTTIETYTEGAFSYTPQGITPITEHNSADGANIHPTEVVTDNTNAKVELNTLM